MAVNFDRNQYAYCLKIFLVHGVVCYYSMNCACGVLCKSERVKVWPHGAKFYTSENVAKIVGFV